MKNQHQSTSNILASGQKDVVEKINCFAGCTVLCDSAYTIILIDTNGQLPDSAIETLNKLGIKFDKAYSQAAPEPVLTEYHRRSTDAILSLVNS